MVVSVIRTVILFAFVIFSIRIMGKRQIAQMQASELVITLLISNIAALPMQSVSVPLLTGVVPIATLVLLELLLSFIMLKNSKIRHFLSGRPVVVISRGVIDQEAMKKIRFSNEDLFEELRKNSVFDISSVEYAIIEPDGELSVLQKTDEMPLTARDAGKKNLDTTLYALLISDGSIENDSVSLAKWNENDLVNTLKKEKTDIEDVFMMIGNDKGDYRIIKKVKK